MAYHLYNTEGLVLAAKAVGESDKIYTFFTPHFGLLRAVATGVREGKSKLRYSLQTYTLAEISLIRGKEFWRLTGSEKTDLLDYLVQSRTKKKLVAKLFSLLLRLIHGEEESERFFKDLTLSLEALKNYPEEPELLANWETLTVLTALKHLGYLKVETEMEPFLSGNWEIELLNSFTPLRAEAIKTINYLLRRSHL